MLFLLYGFAGCLWLCVACQMLLFVGCCCLLVSGCWSLFVVCCSLFCVDVRCALFVGVLLFVAGCVSFVVRPWLVVLCGPLFVVRCRLFDACRLVCVASFVVCCYALLVAGCSLLSVVVYCGSLLFLAFGMRSVFISFSCSALFVLLCVCIIDVIYVLCVRCS